MLGNDFKSLLGQQTRKRTLHGLEGERRVEKDTPQKGRKKKEEEIDG